MGNYLYKLTCLSLFSFHVKIQALFITAEMCTGPGRAQLAMTPQALPGEEPAGSSLGTACTVPGIVANQHQPRG